MIGPKSKTSEKSKISEKSWRLGFVVGFALVSPAVFADEAPPPDARAVVASQLQAFERDDAAQAWQYAAPEVQEKFASAANFLGQVKEKYGPIYRHRSVDFGPASRKGDEVGMVVTLVDRDNEVWSALFLVSRQPDGKWKTAGCLLAKAPQASV